MTATSHVALQLTHQQVVCDFHYELVRFRSLLLTESKVVSIPPLNDMLKFGG